MIKEKLGVARSRLLRWVFRTASERPRLAAAAAIFSVFAIALCDILVEQATGHDYQATALYLFPITMATWLGGRATGYGMMALASIVNKLASAFHLVGNRSSGWQLVGETALQLWIFFIVVELISYLSWTLEHERSISRTDHLTGLHTFKAFKEKAVREIERMKRYRHPISVVYLDVDNFKNINDSMGHSYGNRVLQGVGTSLITATRSVDVPARMGGDEFLVMLPETDGRGAHAVIRRLEEELRSNCGDVTCSIGVATFTSPPESVDDLLHFADQAMYSAKNQGKNRAAFTEVLPTHGFRAISAN